MHPVSFDGFTSPITVNLSVIVAGPLTYNVVSNVTAPETSSDPVIFNCPTRSVFFKSVLPFTTKSLNIVTLPDISTFLSYIYFFLIHLEYFLK